MSLREKSKTLARRNKVAERINFIDLLYYESRRISDRIAQYTKCLKFLLNELNGYFFSFAFAYCLDPASCEKPHLTTIQMDVLTLNHNRIFF